MYIGLIERYYVSLNRATSPLDPPPDSSQLTCSRHDEETAGQTRAPIVGGGLVVPSVLNILSGKINLRIML